MELEVENIDINLQSDIKFQTFEHVEYFISW